MLIVFPLCILRNISFLSYTSAFAIMSALFATFAVVLRSMENIRKVNWAQVKLFSPNFIDIFFALPIMFFAFGSIVTTLPSYRDVKDRKRSRMFIVNALQIFCGFIFYLFMGASGYLLFQDNVYDNILKNFESSNDILMVIAKGAITIVIILSYPLIHWICRESIESMFFPEHRGWKFSWFRWIAIAIALCSASFLVGAFVPSITTVFGFTGSIGGSLIVFVFPCFLFAKAAKSISLKIISVLLGILSIVLGIACTVSVALDTFGVIKK